VLGLLLPVKQYDFVCPVCLLIELGLAARREGLGAHSCQILSVWCYIPEREVEGRLDEVELEYLNSNGEVKDAVSVDIIARVVQVRVCRVRHREEVRAIARI
jgi:hypothetical protein